MRINLGPADLAENQMRGYEVGKRNVLVARIEGKYKALEDWCNHAGCLLSGGWLEGNMVVCACHEIGFDLDTGKNITSPSLCDDQPVVRMAVENGEIILEDFNPEG